MLRLTLILALGFAVHMTAAPTATAGTKSVRHASSAHAMSRGRCYSCRPSRAWAGYEYQQSRGRANTAASYTSMFGI